MKKTIYVCDKCGKEIGGVPIKLVPCSYDETGDVVEIEIEDAEAIASKIQKMDFCASCFLKICDNVLDK